LPAQLHTGSNGSGGALDNREEQFLSPLVCRSDLQGRQYLALGLSHLARRDERLSQIAMRGRRVGGTGGQRRAELPHCHCKVASFERHTAQGRVRASVKWVNQHNPLVRRRQRSPITAASCERNDLPRGCDVRVVVGDQRVQLAQGSGGIAFLFS
jgi:hypothetical protein